MKYSFAKALAAACIALFSTVAMAADKDVEALLAHMRDAYKSVKAATCTTATEAYDQSTKKLETYDLDLAYKNPNLIRLIMKSTLAPGGNVTIISNGQTISATTSEGGTQEIGKFTNEDFDKLVVANLESICFWDWEQQLSTDKGKNMEHSTFKILKDETWNGKHWTVLEETAKQDNVVCRYFIDPGTYLVWRTRVTFLDSGKEQMDAKLTKLDSSANLSDAMFTGS